MSTYLDYAATTPVDDQVLEVFIQTTKEIWGNPSGSHRDAQKARAVLEKSRLQIANQLNTRPLEIYFTSTATEANNLAIQGILCKDLNNGIKPHLLMSPLEHSSISEFSNFPNIETEVYGVKSNGIVDIDDIVSRIRPETRLICLMLVSNEIGTIQPVNELVEKVNMLNLARAKEGLTQIYIHSDCVQAPLYLALDLGYLGVDSAVISGHKLYAPRGGALVYIKNGTQLEKTIYGGGQERELRSGTQNVAAITAFAKAIDLAHFERENRITQTTKLRDFIISFLANELPDVVINGDTILRIANNIHITIPKVDEEYLLFKLDLLGYSVSAGSSCTSGAHKKSRISNLLHPFITGADLRITLGKDNTVEEIKLFCQTLKQLVHYLSEV